MATRTCKSCNGCAKCPACVYAPAPQPISNPLLKNYNFRPTQCVDPIYYTGALKPYGNPKIYCCPRKTGKNPQFANYKFFGLPNRVCACFVTKPDVDIPDDT